MPPKFNQGEMHSSLRANAGEFALTEIHPSGLSKPEG
jgi:hypothetical protein